MSCTFIIYRTKGFHRDRFYTDWPKFIESGNFLTPKSPTCILAIFYHPKLISRKFFPTNSTIFGESTSQIFFQPVLKNL